MTPRAYRLGRRQHSVDRTRVQVLAGARKVLKSRGAAQGFSMEAVARYAGVTRATVYHQFGSKTGLLEALYDHLAARAVLPRRLGAAFVERDARIGLNKLIAAFCRFWANDRLIIRRLHALAALDPSFSRADRGEWHREACREMLGRLRVRRADAIDSLHALTSFETYDSLARGSRGEGKIRALIVRMARHVLGM